MRKYFQFVNKTLTVLILLSSAPAVYADENYNFGSSNAYAFGIEGFHDVYREPGANSDVTDTSNYGSVTGNYTHYWDLVGGERLFAGLDGRASFGKDHYHSADGDSSGATQMEFDVRILGGLQYNQVLGFNGSLSPYTGLGLRYFRDDGKDKVTDLGFYGYDRRIDQIYVPFGLTYHYQLANGWSLKPNIEADVLLGGTVDSRLQNVPGYDDIKNRQDSGYGLRGEFMADWKNNNLTWEFGPFVRYWNIHDSNIACNGNGLCGLEPENTRLQYGAALKLLW